jgi:mannose-6-phosphate isomerase
MNILRMINPTQAYAWGSTTFIQDLLCLEDEKEKPIAELWIGAHPKASSQIVNGDHLVNLDYIIAEDPIDFLGSKATSAFNDQLPFLLKVLSAASPLSIQVHPDQKHAKSGFLKENKLGIPLDASNRCFKDNNHKPELIMALTPFTALCGFRSYHEIVTLLKKYLHTVTLPELTAFYNAPHAQTLKHLFSALLKADAELKKEMLSTFIKSLAHLIPANPHEQLIHEWSFKLSELYPNDIGVLSPLFMNLLTLKPQTSLYLPPGILHSYLEGSGIELMANSDNVLRCGLTDKYVSIDALLDVVDFSAASPVIIKPEKISAIEKTYPTPAAEFALSIIKHSTKRLSIFNPSGSAEVLFCYSGNFVVENCSQFLTLEQGQSLFIPYEVEGFCIEGKGTIYRAKVNL